MRDRITLPAESPACRVDLTRVTQLTPEAAAGLILLHRGLADVGEALAVTVRAGSQPARKLEMLLLGTVFAVTVTESAPTETETETEKDTP